MERLLREVRAVAVKLLEHRGKSLFETVGVTVPRRVLAASPTEAEKAAERLGVPVMVKAQVPTGKRGKAGAVRSAAAPEEAAEVAAGLLGGSVDGYRVETVLVEEQVDIAQELYAAVLNDSSSKCPMVLFSTQGGMDIEEIHAAQPEAVHRQLVDIVAGLKDDEAMSLTDGFALDMAVRTNVAAVLTKLYALYRQFDASLIEVNPLVVTATDQAMALDAKVVIDRASMARQEYLTATAEDTELAGLTELEARARALGFHFIELPGDVGVLANGAGLTMTTLDVIHHFGGAPANFLEIGGDSYTRATPALELVLSNPRVKSLLVNFCGAFARTDVMAEGVVTALESLRPDVPVYFTIHGTGEEDAVRLVQDRLDAPVFEQMDDAVQAAVNAVNAAQAPALEVD